MKRVGRIFRSEYLFLGLLTLILIVGAFFLFSITVKGNRSDDNRIWNEYYAPVESEYVSQVRGYLNESGYVNSGVTLTHTTDENLNRVYTLSVHNRRLSGCSGERREELSEVLRSMGFEDDRCVICVELS